MSAESNNPNWALCFIVSINGSQPGAISASRGHVAMSGDSFGCHKRRGRLLLASSKWVETRDAAKDPTMHRTAPQQNILWPKMSTVPRSRNSGPEFCFRNLPNLIVFSKVLIYIQLEIKTTLVPHWLRRSALDDLQGLAAFESWERHRSLDTVTGHVHQLTLQETPISQLHLINLGGPWTSFFLMSPAR